MAKLSDDALTQALTSLPEWKRRGDEICRTYSFGNYYETMAFVNAVAWLAHKADHHPDMEVGYNRCVVRFSTHDAGGVTAKDVEAARAVNALK